MTESLITMSIVGLLAGFVLSMPIAGPISILITTNALRGSVRYCNLVNIGASFATFTYVFFAVFGLTKLYPWYKPALPYLLTFGSIFLLLMGYKIFKTKLDIEHIEDKRHISEKVKKLEKGGFYTGFIINFLNPTLFLGWLTSTFFIISFVASFGLNTGGLDLSINRSIKEINSFEDDLYVDSSVLSHENIDLQKPIEDDNIPYEPAGFPRNFHLAISLIYAFFISAGSITWFYILSLLVSRFRKNINIRVVSGFIKSMGIVLSLFGLYFGYLATRLLLNLMA
jgi:threonine/homoserine/homoserine lactone efflux protein